MSQQPGSDEKLTRVLIVDDHPIVREALASHINAQPGMICCGEADCVEDAQTRLKTTYPDLILVDISLKHSSGLDLIKKVRATDPQIKLLVISVHDDTLYADRALRAGAMGYVNKQAAPTQLIEAIKVAMEGRVYLSPDMAGHKLAGTIGPASHVPGGIASLSDRELQVLEMIGRGESTKEVAAELNLSVHTIDTYRDKIKKKLNIKGTPALIRRAVQWVLGTDRD